MIAQLEQEGFAVSAACQTLRVGRSGYYAYQQGMVSGRQREDHRLMPMVREIFWEHKRRYGARRIAEELQARGESCGPERVAKLLKFLGLEAIQPKSFRPRTTESRHGYGYSANLLVDAPLPTEINQVWVGDITYIPLKGGKFGYLALLMDLFSRRIVGWELSEDMKESLVLAALRRAIRKRQPRPGLIHHSDRGGQYAGAAYRGVLQRAGMPQSMSRADNCYDNAFMESCFGTIKTELEMTDYENPLTARREIADYLLYYDTKRRHSALGYRSPMEFERALTRR